MLPFVLASIACALTWALASVVFARALRGARGGTPAALNLVKCVLAFPPLVVLGLAQGEGWPTTAGHGPALFASATLGLAVSDTAYFVALAHLGVARGVLFIPLVPVVTAVLAALFLGDPFGATEVIGMALVLGGIVLVIVRADERTAAAALAAGDTAVPARHRLVGVLAGIGSALAQGVSNTLMKTAVVAGSATHVAALRIGFGAIALVFFVAASGGMRTVVPFLRSGIFLPIFFASFLGTFLGMWLGTYGAKGLPIGIATTLAATTPVWALVLARVTGERVTRRAIAGALVAIAGVVMLASATMR